MNGQAEIIHSFVQPSKKAVCQAPAVVGFFVLGIQLKCFVRVPKGFLAIDPAKRICTAESGVTFVDLVAAIGLAAFVSSRVVVGVLIAWNAIVSHLLLAIGSLGGARKAIDVAAAEHFAPSHLVDGRVTMSGATAVIVLAVWIAVFLRAGRFWTVRSDV